MSTVDNRVVRMEFDNQKFESGVGTTLKTLSKLKEALNFKRGNFDELQKGADSVNFNPLSDRIFQVQQHFSLLGELARNVFDRISNSVIDTAFTLGKSLTIEPITQGFQEYETQMNAVQTIMANTQAAFAGVSDKEHLGAVNDALDELNTYADKTIYNFTEMTRNIGTFTAAGVALDTAKSSIQGIANLAAVSGSNSQQASTAMYQLSQAIAAGSLKLQDWNSVVNAGMGGQVFQDALKKTAREHGVAVDAMIEKHGSFRESLQEGWISAEILTETLGKMTDVGLAEYFADVTGEDQEWIKTQIDAISETEDREAAIDGLSKKLAENGKITAEDAKQYLDLMITAQDAATKVKTFSQLIDTVKESLGSGWTQSMEYILGDFEEAKELWSAVYKEIDAIITPISNARNEMLKFWHDTGGRTTAINAIGDAWQGVKAILGAVSDAFKSVFPPMTGQMLVDITNRVADMAKRFRDFATSSGTLSTVRMAFSGLFSVIKMGVGVVTSIFNATKPIRDVLSKLGSDIFYVAGRLGAFLTLMGNATDPIKFFVDSLNGIGAGGTVLASVLRGIVLGVENLVQGILRLVGISIDGNPLTDFFERLRGFAAERLHFPSLETLSSLAQGAMDVLTRLGNFVSGKLNAMFAGAGSMLDGIFGSISGAKSGMSGGMDSVVHSFDGLEAVKGVIQGFVNFVFEAGRKIAEFGGKIGESIPKLFEYLGSAELRGVINNFNALLTGGLINSIRKFVDALRESKESASKGGGFLDTLGSIKEKAEGVVDGLTDILDKLKDSLSAFTNNLNASALMKVAVAVGVLAASIAVLGSIEPDRMARGITGIASAMVILIAGFKALSSGAGMVVPTGIDKLSSALVKMGVAVGILSMAVKSLSGLSFSELATGLVGIGGAMALMVASVAGLSRFGGDISKSANGMITFAAAIRVLASSVSAMGSLSWGQLFAGLTGVGVLLAEIVGFSKFFEGDSLTVKSAVSILGLSAAIKVLESSVADFASMDFGQLAQGLAAVGVLLAELAVFSKTLGSGSMTAGAAVAILATVAAIKVLEGTVSMFASMNWDQLVRGLTGVGVLLVEVAAFSAMMKGHSMSLEAALSLGAITSAIVVLSETMQSIAGMGWEELAKALVGLAGSIGIMTVALKVLGAGSAEMLLGAAAITVLSVALRIFVPVLQSLAAMSIEDIVKSLLSLAASFLVLGAGAAAFGALAPVILLGSAALAAVGAACIVVGAGLLVASAGFTAFAAALVAASASIVASASTIAVGIVTMITSIAVGIANGIVQFAVTLLNGMGEILAALGTAIHAVGDFVVGNLPYLASVLSQIVIALLQVAASAIPQFVAVVSQLVIALIQAIVTWIPPLAQTLVTGVVSLINSVANGIRSNAHQILAAIRNILSAAIELVLTALADIVRLIPGVGPALADQIEGAKDVVRQTLAPESFQEMGQGAVDGMKSGFESGSDGVADPLLNGLKSSMGEFGDIGGMSLDAYLGNFTDTGAAQGAGLNVAGANIDGLDGLISGFGDTGEFNLDAYLGSFTDTGSAELAGTDIAGSNVDGLGSLLGEFGSSGDTNIDTYLKSFTKTDQAKKSGTSVADSGVSGTASRIPNFTASGNTNFQHYDTALKKTDQAYNTGSAVATSGASGAGSKVSNFDRSGTSSLNGYLGGLGKNDQSYRTGSDLAGSGAAGAGSRGWDFDNSGNYSAGNFMDAIHRADSYGAGSAMASNGAAGAGSRGWEYDGSGGSMAGSFTGALYSSSAYGAGDSLSSSGAQGARDQRGAYEGAGSYVAEGFNWSVASEQAKSWALSSGAALGRAALDGIKNAIASASPSKKAMKLGNHTSEGYIIGIQNLVKYAERAGGNLGQKTIDAIAVSAESISDFARMDYEIDPTIRPVMDLSEIQNGVSRANGLIGSIGSNVSLGFDGASYARSMFGGLVEAQSPSQGFAATIADQNARSIEASRQALSDIFAENGFDYDLMADAMLRGMANSGYRIELNDREVGRVVMGAVRNNA